MSVVSVSEIWNGRSGSVDDEFNRSYKRVFRVVTDNATDDAIVIRAGLGIYIFDPYPGDDAARVKSIECDNQDEIYTLWIVTVDYSTSTDGDKHSDNAQQGGEGGGNPPKPPNEQSDNPEDQATEYNWSWENYQRELTHDFFGDPILNSAGDQFDPPVLIDDFMAVLTISKRLPFGLFNPAMFTSRLGAISLDQFMGFPSGTGRIAGLSANIEKDKGKTYWRIQTTVKFKREGWRPIQVLDQGFRAFNPATSAYEWLKKDGAPINSPALLDGNGQEAIANEPVFLEFEAYAEIPFAGDILC